MGVKSATKTKFVGKGLTLKTIQSFNLGNRIDVDGNALVYTFIGNGRKNLAEILSEMASHLKQLAYSGGFIVTVIFDGVDRPDCKRASLQRKKDRFITEANRMYCRFKSLQLKSKFDKEGDLEAKRQLDEYSKECEKLEKACQRSILIPSDVASLFSERLMMVEACNQNENGGYVDERVLTSKFQADSLIASRSILNLNDYIYGNDSDYFVLLGSRCLLLWNMKGVARNTKKRRGRKRKNDDLDEGSNVNDATQYEVEIYGASNEKMKELQSKLHQNSLGVPQGLQWKEVELPLFSSPDPMLRVLVALALGCDVFEGVNTLSPKTIKDKIDSFVSENKEVVPAFKDLIKSRMKTLDDSIINCLVAAFIYEPGLIDETKKVGTCYDESNDERYARTQPYVHNPPQGFEFPTFLQSFSMSQSSQNENEVSTTPDDPNQADNPPMCHCNGFNRNGKHTYLKFEGSHTCTRYNGVFCNTCVFLPSKDIPKPSKSKPNGAIYYRDEAQKILCLDCFKAKRYGEEEATPSVESDLPINPSGTHANVSMDQMRRVLNDRVGLQLTNSDASAAEVMDMYEMYISSPLNSYDAIHLAQAKEKIKYPLFSSETITHRPFFEQVGEVFQFSNGGRFISDEKSVSDDNIPRVLELITSLVKYDEDLVPKSDGNNQNVYVGRYGFLPSMFLHLAYHSRVDSGYRLLDRCARHTCDPKGGSLYYQKASFCEYTDKDEKKGEHFYFIFSLIFVISYF